MTNLYHIMMKIIKIIKDKKDINKKFLQRTDDNFIIESGFYNFDENIICISTQIGCKNGCIFCYSNKKGFVRNLSYKEIVEQAENILNFQKSNKKRILFSYSGMGEPFDNYQNVIKSIKILKEKYKNSRITITTTGSKPELIKKLSNEKISSIIKIHLSLHAPNCYLRKKLMPNAQKMKKALEALYYFYKKRGTIPKINYILINNVNDKKEQLEELIQLIKPYPFIIKLIYLNKIGNLRASKEETFRLFETELKKHGIKSCRYLPSGRIVGSGCGQLRYNFLKNGKY